jgi:hypothetical protein
MGASLDHQELCPLAGKPMQGATYGIVFGETADRGSQTAEGGGCQWVIVRDPPFVGHDLHFLQ